MALADGSETQGRLQYQITLAGDSDILAGLSEGISRRGCAVAMITFIFGFVVGLIVGVGLILWLAKNAVILPW